MRASTLFNFSDETVAGSANLGLFTSAPPRSRKSDTCCIKERFTGTRVLTICSADKKKRAAEWTSSGQELGND